MSSSAADPSKQSRLAPEPLTNCPKCNYALAGLPSAHRCPECGFEYDAYSWAWPIPESKWRNTRLLQGSATIMGLLSIILISTQYKYFVATGILSILLSIAHSINVVMCIGLIRHVIQLRYRPFVAATPKGVTVRGVTKWKQHRTIPWNNIIDVKVGVGIRKWSYRILVAKGYNAHLQPFFRNPEEWEVLKNSILEAKAHYLKESNPDEKST